MSLLELEDVRVRRRDEGGHGELLAGVRMQLDPGELTVVWGMRRSGRSTLLRVAAGVQAPDAGSVRFAGQPLRAHRSGALGSGIGYCRRSLPFADGERVLDHAMVGLLARWVSPARARERAREALERVGAAHCARLRAHQLSAAESIRVALARTLALRPRLLVIDEPVKGVDLIDRDPVLALLRSLADEGLAILASTGESTALSQADHAYVLGAGELRGAPAPSEPPVESNVVPLRRATP